MIEEALQQHITMRLLRHDYVIPRTTLLLSVCYVVLLLLVPAGCYPVLKPQKRSTTSNTQLRPRTSCHLNVDTCEYYSHCIDAMFPCGENGFVLDYAQKRCRVIRNLEFSEPVLTWIHESELLFQRELHRLVRSKYRHLLPDQRNCVRLEREAVSLMNDCYDENMKLSNLLNNREISESQLRTIVSSFRVGGPYYDTLVDSGIPEIVRENGHTQLADSLQLRPFPQRVVFCVSIRVWTKTAGDFTTPQDTSLYVTRLSEYFQRSRGQFEYGRNDSHDDCHPLPDGAPPDDEYHIVTWFSNRSDSGVRWWNDTSRRVVSGYDDETSFFQLDLDVEDVGDNMLCGDGVRQLGEECDYAGVDSPACSLECELRRYENVNNECCSGRLGPTVCWMDVCGDGHRSSWEVCDDGNTNDGDGCSRNCKAVEKGYRCSHGYNTTSVCSAIPNSPISARHSPSLTSQSDLAHSPSTSAGPSPRSLMMTPPLETRSSSSPLSRTLPTHTFTLLASLVLTLVTANHMTTWR